MPASPREHAAAARIAPLRNRKHAADDEAASIVLPWKRLVAASQYCCWGDTMGWIWGLSIVAAALALALAARMLLVRRRRRGGNVLSIKKRRGKTTRCSHCGRKTDKVVFYADPGGKVVGLCRECKTKAAKNGFLPI